jgi:hypothetical protein
MPFHVRKKANASTGKISSNYAWASFTPVILPNVPGERASCVPNELFMSNILIISHIFMGGGASWLLMKYFIKENSKNLDFY